MEDFKKAILQPGPPEHFALQTVQEFIKPQSSAAQSGEPIMQYGQLIDDKENSDGLIPHLLDVVLYLCQREHIEGGMIFQMLEDLTEMSTMRNCKDIFGYIESKQDILGKQELFARGKLVMLRTCNQLLRRLSKANDVVFCGRILMFLAHFFPLSERSAVNIKGVFNTSNETKYEKDPPDGITIDFNYYKTLWSLQEFFCNPASLTPPAKWQKFTSSLTVVLSTFEAQPLSEEEGDANSLEEEAAAFNIKYLTSSKLMGLELKDSSFRRHVLVQCLILFDYLKAPGKTDKDVTSETMKEEVKSCEERVKKLLEMTPPKGKKFLHKIEHILEREKNWVWWKRDGCPPYEKQPVEKKTVQEGSKKRRPRWRMGNKELSQLWKWADQNPNALTDPQRVRTPAITEYWKPLAEDMDPSAGIEADYHHKNNRVYCWKGLRFSARQDLEGFSKFTELGVEGVVPVELLPPDVRSKYQAKPSERSKRVKKEEAKGASQPPEEAQEAVMPASENDGEGPKPVDVEGSATAMETDAAGAAVSTSQGGTPTPEEEKHNSDTDVGQDAAQVDTDGALEGDAEAEAEAETGMGDGETDAEADNEAVS
ncbi:THO complex subunit 1 [Linum perenne]